jgi:signal transduction histidine kinase
LTSELQKRDAGILIVDDTPANLQLLAGMLKDRGYKVRPAPNGKLALQAAQSQVPDLILLDINMPDLSGYEVCTRLKQDPNLRDVPVLFVSALNETLDKVAAFSSGGVDYITKPFQFEEVEARVGAHLRLRQLQIELKKRNAELQAANEELQKLHELRDNLTSMIIHDLRSPLGGIVGYHDLLRATEGPTLSNKGTEYLNRASASSARLVEMVNSLLDISKLEAGELKLKRTLCDLHEIAREGAALLGSLAREKTLEVVAPMKLVTASLDRELIIRVIQNLLANALKYTPGGGKVSICIADDEKGVCMSVTDTGPGIPPEYHERIFEKFGQVASGGPRVGTGLGLTFCRLAVEAHGGRIGVESEQGRGSRFWFVLPARVS